MRMRLIMLLGLICVSATAAATEGDPEHGREIAYTCKGCHAIPHHNNVYPTYSVPKVSGQTHGYLVAALEAYRAGNRQHPTMNAQANTLSDQDILDIAAYFSGHGEDE